VAQRLKEDISSSLKGDLYQTIQEQPMNSDLKPIPELPIPLLDGDETVQQDGLRLYDEWEINPVQGRKKRVKLTRSTFKVIGDEMGSPTINSNKIHLPQFGPKIANYILSLIPTGSNQGQEIDKRGRYLLTSTNGHPFRINGIVSFQSFIRRGDIVDMGFNRFKYISPHDSKSNNWNFLPCQELISSNLNILLEGESGVGKTFWAEKIHHASGRRGNFIHINLSSFAESLIESELFGHVKGAFTGAIRNKQGALASAENGTLFLDELDSLPHSIQTKLLLFLDSKQYRPVGGVQNRSVNVRTLFASGRPLEELVTSGEFRRDFYFRVSSGIKIKIPSLRGQSKLIKHHCQTFATKEEITISPRLGEYYQSLPWPGNVRQLYGHLMKKKITTKGPYLNYNQLDQDISYQKESYNASAEGGPYPTLDEVKRHHARMVLHHFEGNLKKSCQILGITKNTLRKMVA
jgi:hypothetical protein